jgi:hypothetical protein
VQITLRFTIVATLLSGGTLQSSHDRSNRCGSTDAQRESAEDLRRRVQITLRFTIVATLLCGICTIVV